MFIFSSSYLSIRKKLKKVVKEIITFLILKLLSDKQKNRKQMPAVSLRRKIESPFFI